MKLTRASFAFDEYQVVRLVIGVWDLVRDVCGASLDPPPSDMGHSMRGPRQSNPRICVSWYAMALYSDTVTIAAPVRGRSRSHDPPT
jgi:hypothetical protein